MSRVLGLDVSTAVTGYTVIDGCSVPGNAEIVVMDHISFDKCAGIWEKNVRLRDEIKRILTEYQPDVVYIEEALLSFRPGLSSAQTISTLMKFNGLASWFVYEITGQIPKFIASTTARKVVGIHIQQTQKCGKTAKQQVFEWATGPTGPLSDRVFDVTRTGKYKPYNYDRVDSWVIARAGLDEELNKTSDAV